MLPSTIRNGIIRFIFIYQILRTAGSTGMIFVLLAVWIFWLAFASSSRLRQLSTTHSNCWRNHWILRSRFSRLILPPEDEGDQNSR